MGEDIRSSGIQVIGDIPWGTHFCQFYESGDDLLDILVPYFKAGLESNEFCMWVTAHPLSPEDAERALREALPDIDRHLESGQLEIVPHDQWYLQGSAFDLERVLNGWLDRLHRALRKGYDGMRLTGNTGWLEKQDWQSFTGYERAIDGVTGKHAMIALCTYPVSQCGIAEAADVVSNHQFALIKRQGEWKIIESAERRRAEGELRKLLRAVEQSSNTIVITDTNGTIEYVNPKFTQLTGYTAEEAIGLNPRVLKSGHVPPEVYQRLWETITSGRDWHGEFLNKKKNGELYWESASISPVRNAEGIITNFVAVKEDITERKLTETERERLLAELERRAAELDASNKELEAFSYSVSHDLRAPLRAVDSFSKALLEDFADKLGDEGKQYLEFVRQGSQRMAQLIEDMLSLSRVTRTEIQRTTVDLTEIAGSIVDELRKSRPERKVEFIISPGLVTEGDPGLLRLVLENLLDNAWKFTSKHPTARIEFGADVQNGQMVHFVRDDGAGFEPAYSEKLFGVFQRLHSEHEFPGNGIGLATVQRIIRRHGGRVWAEGAVEKGATFYFTLSIA